MNKLILTYILTVIFLLAVLAVRLHENGKDCPQVQTETVYVYDTVMITKTDYVPVPETIIKNIYIPANIDTAKIIETYFSTLHYSDTLIDDTTALIIVKDSISENRLFSRSWEFQNRQPVQIITTVNQVNSKLRIGVGACISAGNTNFGFAPSVIISKNKSNFTISYDLVQKNGGVGYYYFFN